VFHFAVLPLPLHRSIAAVAAVAVERERNCWKRLSIVPLCTSDQNADWLSTNSRTAKIGFNPISYGTAVTAQRQAGTAQRNGGNQQRNSYSAYGILTEFVSTATAKQNAGNQALHVTELMLISHSLCIERIEITYTSMILNHIPNQTCW